MPVAGDIRRLLGKMFKQKSAKVALVLVLTLTVLINSLMGINKSVEGVKRRMACADIIVHRGKYNRQLYNRRLTDSDCANIWPFPEGTGELVPWTDTFPPKTHGADYDVVPPSTKVGYVVNYKNCPQDFIEDKNYAGSEPNTGDGFPDDVAVIQQAVTCSIPTISGGTVVDDSGGSTGVDPGGGSGGLASVAPTMYALMHPDAVTCMSANGTDYDRATLLQGLGYWVKIWNSPLSESSLENQPYIAENIEDDVGLKDFMKLNALKLLEHDFVVIMDQDYILKKSLDPVLKELEDSGKIAAYVRDPVTGGLSTDILILKPDLGTYDDLLDTFTTTPYTEDGGWGDSGIGKYPGGMGTSGLIDYFMNGPDPSLGTELDRCTYANNADDTCHTKPFEDIVGYTMSPDTCGKPWECTYGELEALWSSETKIMCTEFLIHWVKSREEFESLWTYETAPKTGEDHVEIYHGMCTKEGPEGYIPLLREMVPDVENCIDHYSNDFHGCDPSATSDSTATIGSRSQLQVYVSSPQQCETFTAEPNNGGAIIPFSGVAEIVVGTGVADTSMVFVIDRSGSACDIVDLSCASDENYDLQYDDVLDCEIAAILDLVAKARVDGSVSKIGLVSFSNELGNIESATIELPLTDIDIPDQDQFHAIENAIRNINCGGATNYAAAVQKACEVIDSSTTDNNVVIFISDGEPTRGGAPSGYCGNNAVFHTIALGPFSTCVGGDDTSLEAISLATEGTCQQVPTIKDIRLVLKEISEAKVESFTGTTVASSSTVNFGCQDVPSYSNQLGLGCDYFTEEKCGGFLSEGFPNTLGQTANAACCSCGGGIYNNFGTLETNENVAEVDPSFTPNENSLDVVAYEDVAIMHPGTHIACTTVIGAEGGVHGAVEHCRKILVCPHPSDYA